jgi:hypothetical protein
MVWNNTHEVALNFTYIIATSLIGFIASNLNYSVILQYEKNKYSSYLNGNSAVFNSLFELKKVSSIYKHSLSFFFVGWIIGYIYFNILMIYIIKILVFVTENNLDIFYFMINPYIGVSGKLIDAAYFNFTIFLLAIIWYFIYVHTKLQITSEQSITWKFKGQLYSLCTLAGTIFISFILIFIYILKSIIPEFVVTEIDYATIFLSPLFVLGFLATYLCIKRSCDKILDLKNESKMRISELYEIGYPCVTISTTSKEINGKIKNILDSSVLIIIDKNKNTIAIPWNNIIFIKILDSQF